MIRVECSQCKAVVTRKYITQHDCFESVQSRLKKLDKTMDYVRSRIDAQGNCKRKFEFVLQQVKRKLMSHNKRIDCLLFSSVKPLGIEDFNVPRHDTAISVSEEAAWRACY